MKMLLAAVLSLCPALAGAGEVSSAYTDFDFDKTCKTVAKAGEGEGDWIDAACKGYGGYPVQAAADDLRESIFYGFAPKDAPWESFAGFNHAGPKIEWRLQDGKPFAVIHRWFVGNSGPGQVQVLVIEKVGQKKDREGCAVGLVLATGNPKANSLARKIADERARTFRCGEDKRQEAGGKLPDFSVSE
jgi:hypothetical protein